MRLEHTSYAWENGVTERLMAHGPSAGVMFNYCVDVEFDRAFTAVKKGSDYDTELKRAQSFRDELKYGSYEDLKSWYETYQELYKRPTRCR
jgi:hypothetical protein